MNCFKNILYVAEPEAAQETAVARAVSLAVNNQADLTAVAVLAPVAAGIGMPLGGPISADLQAAAAARQREALESLVAPYREQLQIRLEVLVGSTFLEVIRSVLRDGHDLVIKPAENPGFMERLFGSNDMHLLRKCPCPVWLTQPAERSNYECILAAVDFAVQDFTATDQGINRRILELSASLALSDFATLHLMHAWDAPAEVLLRTWSDKPEAAVSSYVESERARHQEALDGLREQLREQVGRDAYAYLTPRFHLVRETAATAIPRQAKLLHADLVVMGTVARTGISGLIIGNTAEAILEQLRCSVLAIKPPGFVSPVKLDD